MLETRTAKTSGDFDLDLSELLGFLASRKATIFLFIIVSVLLTGLYILVAPPIYQVDAVLQVEMQKKGFPGLEGLSELLGESSSSNAEIEIIRTRSILSDVVKSQQLDLIIEPNYFPLIGSIIAKIYTEDSLAEPLFGFDEYPWGGEQLEIPRFEIDGPKSNEVTTWTLIAGEDNSYKLIDADETMEVEGEVGTLLNRKFGFSEIHLLISSLFTRPDVEYNIIKHPMIDAVSRLSSELQISEKGRDTGIIGLSLEGDNKQEIVSTLNAVTTRYVNKNIEVRSAEAQQLLQFIGRQLPLLKEKLDSAEMVLQQYQQEAGTIDLSFEAQNAVSQLVNLDKEISELELRRTELRQQYTDLHPTLTVIASQLEQLDAKRKIFEEQLHELPETEWLTIQKKRDVEVANELYLLMLNKQQELRLVKEGTVASVRIVDEAITPSKPVKPKKAVLLITAAAVGMILGIFFVLIQRMMNKCVTDSDEIVNETGLSVFASIPYSKIQDKLTQKILKNSNKQTGTSLLLAFEKKDGITTEAFRSLRTSMQFASRAAENNIVVISGPSPSVGKSFVSSNIGAILADSGKNVLVVDGDMRRGHLHKYMGVNKSPGLSELIGTDIEFDKTIVRIKENISFIPSGRIPPNPAELLMTEKFHSLLTRFSGQFDVVIIDTPPILAVTDASIIARDAAQTFILLGYGKHHMKEIKSAILRFEQSGINITGMIMNDVEMKASSSGSDNYYYSYR